jgi:hypothetical protein
MSKLVGPKIFTIKRIDHQGNAKSWQKAMLDPKARVVCQHCNSGWMSDLETQIAKPTMENLILYGSPISLLRLGVASIVAFAFKGAAIADAMHTGHAPFYSVTQRRNFARHLRIPDGTQVWLTALPNQRGIFKSHYARTPVGRTNGFHLHIFTFGMGHFGFQLVSVKWAARNQRRHEPAPSLRQASADDDLATPLWPWDGGPILWPPQRHLSEEITNQFALRWKDLHISI